MIIRETLRRGFQYVAAGQFLNYVVRFGSNLVLTRLLAPDLFGLMALGSAFIYAAVMMCDIGLRSAIIQDARAQDRRFRDIVWSVMTMRLAVFLTLLAAALWGISVGTQSGFLSADSLYADPRLPLVLMLLALAEGIKFLESVELLHRERQMQFHTLFRFETARQLISTAVTVSWAWVDPGVVALCAGSVVSNAAVMALSYVLIARRAPRWVWAPSEFKSIVLQGRWLLVSAILTFAMNALDRVYLAKYFNATELGLYSIAMIFGLLVVDLISKVGASVIFPVISERARLADPELWRSFYQARRTVLGIALGSGFFFIAFGDNLIRLLYDPRYHAAGPILQAFGVVALLSLYAPSGDAYLAMGRAKINSIVYLVRVLTLLAALMVLVPDSGPKGGVWALVVSHGCGAVVMLFFNRRLGLFRWREEMRAAAALSLAGLAALALSRV